MIGVRQWIGHMVFILPITTLVFGHVSVVVILMMFIVITPCSLTNVMSLLLSYDRVTNLNLLYPTIYQLTLFQSKSVTSQLLEEGSGLRVTMTTNLHVSQPNLQQLIVIWLYSIPNHFGPEAITWYKIKKVIIWPYSINEFYWGRSNHMAKNKE